MKVVSLAGVSDSTDDEPVPTAYHSLSLGKGDAAWFEISLDDAIMKGGGWGTPTKQKPQPK